MADLRFTPLSDKLRKVVQQALEAEYGEDSQGKAGKLPPIQTTHVKHPALDIITLFAGDPPQAGGPIAGGLKQNKPGP